MKRGYTTLYDRIGQPWNDYRENKSEANRNALIKFIEQSPDANKQRIGYGTSDNRVIAWKDYNTREWLIFDDLESFQKYLNNSK